MKLKITGSKGWLLVIAFIVIILASITLYSGMLPPASVVESGSMQHSDYWTPGVINTGDIVLVKKATNPLNQVTTYVQGRTSGYSTYGEYGNVILYKAPTGDVIIHRAIFYLYWNHSQPEVLGYTNQSWIHITSKYIEITDVGYSHRNLVVYVSQFAGENGFITVGDHNLATATTKSSSLNAYIAADQNIFGFPPVNTSKVVGVAYGQIPWIGLIKLNIMRAFGEWNYNNEVPKNSYLYLGLTIAAVVAIGASPYIIPGKKKKK